MNTFKLKGSKEFTVQCIGTVKDERGVKHDQWQVTCANFGNRKNFIPKIWPFGDDTGNTVFKIKQPKNTQTCKKVLAKKFKTNRVIRCEHDESRVTGCQCSENAKQIAQSSNTAKNEKLALTATCGDNRKDMGEMENWNLHCDKNGNGVVDDGEETGTVRVITKPNSNYCKVKKTVSSGFKCTKPPTTSCLCAGYFDTLNYKSEFKKEAKNGITLKVECVNGNSVYDKYRFTAFKNGKECQKQRKVTLKHNNVENTCQRKLLNNLKNFVKEEGFNDSC